MKTTFKKTLLALALTGVAGSAMAAVDLSTGSTAVAHSVERLGGTAVNVTTAKEDLVIELGAEYAVGDIIKLTFNTDAVAASEFLTTITSSDTLALDGTPAANGAGATVTLGLLSSDATSVTYRVTEVSAALTTVGQKFTVAKNANMNVNAAKLKAAGKLTVTYSAQTSNGVTIDAGNDSTFTMIYTASEFSVSVAAANRLNGVIDVNASRLNFDDAAAPANHQDVLTITAAQLPTVDPDGTGPLLPVAFANPVAFVPGLKYVVKGDFSWVKDADANTAGIQPAAAALTIAACTGATDATDAVWTVDSVTFTCTDAAPTSPALTFDIGQGAAKAPIAVNPSDFTVTATIGYNDGAAKSLELGPINAGAWTLNGSVVRVPYMVVQNGRFGTILNVTNHSSKDGDITLDVFDEDGTVLASNYAAGVSKAGSVTNVAQAARNALTAAGKNLNNVTKFSVQIVTNVPEDDVIVYAAYTDANNGGERAIVNNDSKVQTK